MTVSLDINTARHIAHLARINVADDELANYAGQLSAILEYVEQLQALDTSNVIPTAHAIPTFDVLREDKIIKGLGREEALANAPVDDNPEKSTTFFRVPKVLDQEGA
ncbi:MAG: Asp-tRNA(Asn)/Glu-tRNA(Gln) amidotransferase subunit GatC [Planctomycetota bacterium]|jgi:aspartyl-tRNA(Asn)/glutamyl-tRNA(Gln) amidotransferase subunit C